MSTWILKQWPVPLVAAAVLVVMLAAQRFASPTSAPEPPSDTKAAKLQELPLAFEENRGRCRDLEEWTLAKTLRAPM